MKSKGSLVIIELGIMILIFAFAAAICTTAFSNSHLRMEADLEKNKALDCVQDVAEVMKSKEGDLEATAEVLEVQLAEDEAGQYFDFGEIKVYAFEVQDDKSLFGLGQVGLSARNDAGDEHIYIDVCWQKEI